MRANKLKLNPEKTHILKVGTQQRLKTLKPLEVYMDNMLLKEDPSHKESLLGCQIQGDLKWQNQVSSLKSRLAQRLNGLRHLRYICTYSVRKMIAEGCFNSVLIYCLPVFGGLEQYQVKELQVLQNQAARIVCKASPRANRSLLFKKLDWFTVNQLIHYHSILTLHRVRVTRTPEYLANILCCDSRNFRIMIPRNQLTLTANSFCYRSASVWNQLPFELRSQGKNSIFKNGLREWIMSNIPSFLD